MKKTASAHLKFLDQIFTLAFYLSVERNRTPA